MPQPFAVAFTGTMADGRAYPGMTGEDWTLPPGIDLSRDVSRWTCGIGYPEAGGSSWLNMGYSSCDLPQRLYCLATDNASRVTVSAPAGARVTFLSQPAFQPWSGPQQADRLCATEAAAACLSGSFKALLAIDWASALSRFNISGPPWVRPDGVLIAEKPSDLAGQLLAPIDVTADGRSLSNSGVWTGAADSASASQANCANWTSRGASGQGTDTVHSGGAWFFREPLRDCESAASVYCLQE